MNNKIEEPLEKIAQHLEEEARMVLPGIQALFGFQLVAVFNQRFTELSDESQRCHYVALILSSLSVLLVLIPAAYHRQAEPTKITKQFCMLGSKLLTMALLPLATAIGLDLYVIGILILKSEMFSWIIGAMAFFCLIFGWFVFPQIKKRSGRHK